MAKNPVDKLVDRMLDDGGDFRWAYKVRGHYEGRGKTRKATLIVTPEYEKEKADGTFITTITRGQDNDKS